MLSSKGVGTLYSSLYSPRTEFVHFGVNHLCAVLNDKPDVLVAFTLFAPSFVDA